MNQEFDEPKLLAILKSLNLNEFVKNLEKGIDTTIDSDMLKLSGGELQRITIARALYSESKYLFMDEPFASLDLENANKIEERILELKDRTVIISHKINQNMIYKYDQIIEF